jgi:hypothetical protein
MRIVLSGGDAALAKLGSAATAPSYACGRLWRRDVVAVRRASDVVVVAVEEWDAVA